MPHVFTAARGAPYSSAAPFLLAAVLALAAFLVPALATAWEWGEISAGSAGGGVSAGSVMVDNVTNEGDLEEALAPVTGRWKKHYASPSVGVALYKANIRFNSVPGVVFSNLPFDEREYYVPALDARIFRGTNITKRAGFFWGIEAGTSAFLPYAESFYADITVTDNLFPNDAGTYNNILDSGIDTFKVAFHGGSVFLMLKYGYRFELGFSQLGLSAGFQLGTGASVFSGGYDVYAGSRGNPVAKAGYGTRETQLDVATDFSIEAALRLGRNFRIFAAAGMLVTPFEIDDDRRDYVPGSEVLRDPAPTNEKYLRYALYNYHVEIDAVGFSLRGGFILNFN